MNNSFKKINIRKSLLALSVSLCFMPALASAIEIPNDGNLTLQDAVRIAIKNAPQMITASIQVELAKATELGAASPFDADFQTSFAKDFVRGYQYPAELQALPANLTTAAAALSAYNTSQNSSLAGVAPAITPPLLSTFMTDHQDNAEFDASITKLFRNGIYTGFSLKLQSSDSDKVNSDLSQLTPTLSNGIPGYLNASNPGASVNDYSPIHPSIVQLTVNIPLLQLSGENNILTAGETQKRLQREAATMNLKQAVAGIVQNVVNRYWAYKAALIKLQYEDQFDDQVRHWLEKLEKVASKNTGKEVEGNTELDHLRGFSTQVASDVSNAKEQVNVTRNALAVALGVSSDDATKIVSAYDDYPLDWSDVLANFNDAAKKHAWNELAMQNRFDLKAYSLQLDGANAFLLGAENNALPKLDLALILKRQGLSVGGSNEPTLESLHEGTSALGGTVQLSFDYKFDNSQAKSIIAQAKLQVLGSKTAYDNAVRTATLDVDSSVSSIRNTLVSLASAKKQTAQYTKALHSEVKNDTLEFGKVFDTVLIEQAREKAYIDNVTAIENVADAVTAVLYRTGTLVKQADNIDDVVITDVTKLP